MHARIVSRMYTCTIFNIMVLAVPVSVSPILEIEGSKQRLSIANVANVFDLDATNSDRFSRNSVDMAHLSSLWATRSTHVVFKGPGTEHIRVLHFDFFTQLLQHIGALEDIGFTRSSP